LGPKRGREFEESARVNLGLVAAGGLEETVGGALAAAGIEWSRGVVSIEARADTSVQKVLDVAWSLWSRGAKYCVVLVETSWFAEGEWPRGFPGNMCETVRAQNPFDGNAGANIPSVGFRLPFYQAEVIPPLEEDGVR
jgi:hypothetical protein